MSRATLYRLYQRSDGIARHVRRRRGDAVRRALEVPEPRSLDELAQAYRLVRAFRADHGIDRADYSARVRYGRDDALETGTRRWSGWMHELD